MAFLIFLITLIFICLAFFSNLPQGADGGLWTFVVIAFEFIKHYALLFLFGSVLAAVYFMFTQTFEKHLSRLRKFYRSLMYVGALVFLGFFLSYISLFVIAFLQLNIFAVLIDMHPGNVGLQTDKNSIISSIKANGAPEVVISNKDTFHQLVAIATATTGIDNYYGKYILSGIPAFIIIPMNDLRSTVFLIDNTLIVTAIEQKDLQAISPILGHLLIKDYFWRRNIKAYPTVRLLGRNDYATYRLADAKKRLTGVEKTLAEMTEAISTTSAEIENDKNSIEDAKIFIASGPDQMNQEYKTCLLDNTKVASSSAKRNCRDIVTKWNRDINDMKSSIASLEAQMVFNQNQVKFFKEYEGTFATQATILKSRKNAIPFELGLFEPKDSINIVVLSNQNSIQILNFFQTYIHEYLHYASHISEKEQLNDGFFEEAITEYFARNIIENKLHIKTNFGYPVQVKILTEMTRKIPETDFADIYFTKDNAALERILNNVYGENFYQKNRLLFATLQYTSSQQQALQVANEIMKRIGGPKLKAEDLVSTMK